MNDLLEREYEKVQLENAKLRRHLNEYILRKNELVHITLSPSKWREFCDYLATKRKNNEENKIKS